jgi:hypothetical protein
MQLKKISLPVVEQGETRARERGAVVNKSLAAFVHG